MEMVDTQSQIDSDAIMSRGLVEKADLVIVGGGPAGLSAGIYARRNGLEAVVIEKGKLGGQVLDTTIVENYPGMKQVEGTVLADVLSAHALDYVTIHQNETVIDITPGTPLTLQTDQRVILTRAIIVATGAKRRPLGLKEEGEFFGKGLSYSPTKDAALFSEKDVIIVGGGDSAATEALYLADHGVRVTLIHRSNELDAQDTLKRRLEERSIPVRYNVEVKSIVGNDHVEAVELYHNDTGQGERLLVDGVFVSIGYVPAFELAEKIGLDLTREQYIEHQSCRTNIKGIYVAGDISGGFKQIITASGQGAEAALTVFNDIKSGKI